MTHKEFREQCDREHKENSIASYMKQYGMSRRQAEINYENEVKMLLEAAHEAGDID